MHGQPVDILEKKMKGLFNTSHTKMEILII